VDCANCGKTLHRKKHRIECYDNHFCNMGCLGGWRSEHRTGEDCWVWEERVTRSCEWCGDEVTRRPGYPECEHTFCDLECYGSWLSARRSGEDHPQWKGGKRQYGAGWTRRKRNRVRIRDQARCQSCGMTEPDHQAEYGCALHVHHTTPARQFDDPEERNAMENLITLCISCHTRWEQMAPLHPDTPAD
jgi:hypothetical protein